VSALSTDELLDIALERTVQVTGATAGSMYFPRADGDWELSVGYNLPEEIRSERAVLSKDGPALRFIIEQGGAATWTERVDEPPQYISPASKRAGIQSWAAATLTSGENVFGILILYSREYDAFGKLQLELLRVIGQFLGLALANTVAHARAYLHVDAQLQHRVAELEAVLASMSDGLIICDQEGKIVRVNTAAARILRRNADSLLGQSVLSDEWNRVLDESGTGANAHGRGPFTRALVDGEVSVKCPIEMNVGDQMRVLSVSASPVRRADGRSGAVAVIRDITEEHRADQMKEEFLSILSHELRAPLTVISGYAQVLGRRLRQKEMPEEAAYCDLIKEHSQRMASMVGDLVDSGRLESGLLPIEKLPVKIEGLVESVVNRITRDVLSATGNITISTHIEPDLPMVMADMRRIDQVLTNLLTNAIKYSPGGGNIEVAVQRVRAEGSPGKWEEEIKISVTDQGIGIPPEERRRVFERAFRGVRAKAISAQGLGLGLYISKLAVEAHGGRISVEEGPGGVGSRFWFTLPVNEKATDA
jgi:PAS domain S-box-containing protein